jgi:hypothetical protein
MSDLVVVNLFPKILLILPLLSACTGVRTIESQTPTCSDPARLEGHADVRAPGAFISFKPGVEPRAAAARMALKYHFNKAIQYSWGAIFSSDLELKLIPLIRCEPDVEYLEFNQVVTIGRTVTVDAPRG